MSGMACLISTFEAILLKLHHVTDVLQRGIERPVTPTWGCRTLSACSHLLAGLLPSPASPPSEPLSALYASAP